MQRQMTWRNVQRVAELMSASRDPAYPSHRQETLRNLERALASLDEIYADLPTGPLTPTQFRAMRHLAEGGPSTLGALALATGASPSTTTGVADRLESHHLVQRAHPEQDRRTVTLAVTTEGSYELTRLTDGRVDRLDRMLSRLHDEDLAMLFGYVAVAEWIVTHGPAIDR